MRVLMGCAAGAAAACGLPLYLALDRLDRLPPALRDAPWPLSMVASLLALVALALGWRTGWSRGAKIAAAVAAISPVLLMGVANATAARLPAPSSELPSGVPLPDASLLADDGTPLRLTDLRGRPTVLVIYRGTS